MNDDTKIVNLTDKIVENSEDEKQVLNILMKQEEKIFEMVSNLVATVNDIDERISYIETIMALK